MTDSENRDGSCFCGAVRFTAAGNPKAMGYCHCESCRHWSAGPVNAFTLWSPNALQITQGEDNIDTYSKTSSSQRERCRTCGGHLYTVHPEMGLVDIYAALLPKLPFKPGVHVHYQETVLPIRDGATKYRDVPAELGGSGATMSE